MSTSQPLQERYPVNQQLAAHAHVDRAAFEAMTAAAQSDPDRFWGEIGQRIDWIKPYSLVSDVSFDLDDLHIRWYADGTLNACANCLDRHLDTRGDQVAIIWEGDDPAKHLKITYRELHDRVCRFANGLKALGIRKGDRVTIYLPMIPEAAVAMLACARIGAVHSIVFGGFSPDALAGRIIDCESSLVITADAGVRGGRSVGLKSNVDTALQNEAAGQLVQSVLVVRNTNAEVQWFEGRDVWLDDVLQSVDADCPAEAMNAEDPLFILYTSGSTGKPKGVLHTTGGYLVYASWTHEIVFDYQDGEVYWCTAD
ncbi:MAG: AMP-binding protein, partial [Pseudomonadota bacterium]